MLDITQIMQILAACTLYHEYCMYWEYNWGPPPPQRLPSLQCGEIYIWHTIQYVLIQECGGWGVLYQQ